MNGDEITVPTHDLTSLRDLRAVLERGENAKGQLGDGTTTQQKRPVKAPLAGKAVAAVAGSYHSLAVLENGECCCSLFLPAPMDHLIGKDATVDVLAEGLQVSVGGIASSEVPPIFPDAVKVKEEPKEEPDVAEDTQRRRPRQHGGYAEELLMPVGQ